MKSLNIVITMLLLPGPLLAQPQWGNLQPGRYAIGYKTINAVDYTRNYFDRGRPIQIYMWYPARPGTGEPMEYGGYFEDIGKDWGQNTDTAALRQYIVNGFKSGALNPSFQGSLPDEAFKKILDTAVPVVNNGIAVDEKFPVLLHMHANGALTQSIMMEYFASHGYVAMSISMYGSSPAYYARGEGTAGELLNLTEDLGFILAEAGKIRQADVESAAMIGMLSQIGLSLQFKEKPLKAIACLDCSWRPEVLRKMPYFDPKAVRIPILELVNTGFANQEESFLDSLPYALRYIGRLKNFPHADFYPFPKIATPEGSSRYTNYEFSLILSLNFLNAALKNDTAALDFMQALADEDRLFPELRSMRKERAAPAIPTEHEFLTWLRYGEMGKAKKAWSRYGKGLVTENNIFISTLFLARERAPHAYEAFNLYISEFPASPRNVMLYQHLGDALLELKKPQLALEVYSHWRRQFPDSPHVCMAVSDAQLLLGWNNEAVRNLEQALEKAASSDLTADEKAVLIKSVHEKLNKIK